MGEIFFCEYTEGRLQYLSFDTTLFKLIVRLYVLFLVHIVGFFLWWHALYLETLCVVSSDALCGF